MAYSRVKLNSNNDKASPCFGPFCVEDSANTCPPIRTVLQVSFNTLIGLTKLSLYGEHISEIQNPGL